MLSVGTQNEKLHKVSQSRKRLIRKSVSVNGLADRSFESALMLAPPSPSFNLFTLKSSSALNVCWNSNQYGFPPVPLVIAGPSGSGKSTLLNRLMGEFQDCCALIISHTTRKPRPGETNGKEYFFVDTDTFEQSIQNEEFIEFTRFSNNYYGTSKKSVLDVQNSGKICLLDVEMDGVKNLKKTDLNPRFVFIKPPSMEILEQRLRSRGTESDESLKRRLDRAIEELRFGEVQGIFDLTITNHDVDKAYKILRDFIVGDIEKLKKSRGM